MLATVNANSRKSDLKSAGYRCSVKGCDNPPERGDQNREWPLCSHHYNCLKQKAGQCRDSGRTVDVFKGDPPRATGSPAGISDPGAKVTKVTSAACPGAGVLGARPRQITGYSDP